MKEFNFTPWYYVIFSIKFNSIIKEKDLIWKSEALPWILLKRLVG